MWRQNPFRDACRSPAVRGKKRCRMHGGAPGSGAPRANQNARKHGLFTRDAIAERRQIQAVLGEARKLLEGMDVEKDHAIGLYVSEQDVASTSNFGLRLYNVSEMKVTDLPITEH